MADNKGVAPICNGVQSSQQFENKIAKIPGFTLPTADNIVPAILQLQQALKAIQGQGGGGIVGNNVTNNTPGNTSGSGSPPFNGFGGGGGGKNKQQQQGNWQEVGRVTENVKVVNPDDDSQFVIVKEIVSITFENSTTGDKIVIKRDP